MSAPVATLEWRLAEQDDIPFGFDDDIPFDAEEPQPDAAADNEKRYAALIDRLTGNTRTFAEWWGA